MASLPALLLLGLSRAHRSVSRTQTWWLVRDNMRGQAYNMKANMKAMYLVLEGDKKVTAKKAYDKFWSEINALDLACVKKEQDLAKKEYGDVLAALKAYEAAIA